MADCKKVIPSFGCRGNQKESVEILALARFYNDNGADALLIYDLSETEAGHETMIGILKDTARIIDIPIITGGAVKRLEDVKKYLYAGAKAVFFQVWDEEQVDLMKEASDRFGSEKIYACLNTLEQLKRVPEFAQLGASMMLLDTGAPLTKEQLAEVAGTEELFYLVCHAATVKAAAEATAAADFAVDAIAAYLDSANSAGVILPIQQKAENDCMQLKQELKACGLKMNILETNFPWSQFKLNSDGLIPVIVQDYKTLEVLMMAYMNEESFQATLHTGKMTYFSRSRQSLWLKGETSGHYQYVKSLDLDCDNDTILAKVNQVGAACHTGSRTCFFQNIVKKDYKETNPLKVFEDVFAVILDRKENPKEGSYTNYLFDKGIDKILKKVGEEATEIVIAAKNPDPEEIKYEISDFLYHVMVLMAEKGVTWEEITQELANR